MAAATVQMVVTLDTARPQLAAIRDALTTQAGKEAAGLGVRRKIRSHLRAMPPNKRFPEATTGYYKDAAESVTAPVVDGDLVTISITQTGFRQRLLGGPIDPVNAGMLTLRTWPGSCLPGRKIAPETLRKPLRNTLLQLNEPESKKFHAAR